MGGTLPALAKRVVAGPREVGVKLGTLYAINTFGGVAGTAACGFWLIPTFGIQGTTGLAVGLNVAVGALAWFGPGRAARNSVLLGGGSLPCWCRSGYGQQCIQP